MSHKTTKKGTKLPISKIKGKDYLEVKWRLVWFREDFPGATIQTNLIQHDDNKTLFQAIISNGHDVLATAHKQEVKGHFPDHLEKAETGAIGRALAMCGYGTQFDGGDLAEGERLADAPVDAPVTKKARSKEALLSQIRERMVNATDNYKNVELAKEIYKKMGVSGWKELQSLTEKGVQEALSIVL